MIETDLANPDYKTIVETNCVFYIPKGLNIWNVHDFYNLNRMNYPN